MNRFKEKTIYILRFHTQSEYDGDNDNLGAAFIRLSKARAALKLAYKKALESFNTEELETNDYGNDYFYIYDRDGVAESGTIESRVLQ